MDKMMALEIDEKRFAILSEKVSYIRFVFLQFCGLVANSLGLRLAVERL